MEWFAGFLVVLGIVLLVGGAFAAVGVRGPWSGLLWFFVLLFFATWAIGAWTRPIGPQTWGVNWIGFLMVAILVALLIGAATPSETKAIRRNRVDRDASSTEALDAEKHAETQETRAAVATAVGLVFWIFIIFAVTIVILSFLFGPVIG